MKKEEILEEMLTEIKNLKDLTKEELPLVSKEYIKAEKVKSFLLLGLGTVLSFPSSIWLAYFCSLPRGATDFQCAVAGISGVSLFFGVIMTFIAISELLDLFLQPRRMAIKAITSLRNND